MKVTQLVVLIFVVVSFFGCTLPVPPPVDNPAQTALNKNRVLWKKSNISSYIYTYKTICFCPEREDIAVAVTNGQVAAASYSPSGTPLTSEELVGLFTVEGLFEVIEKAIEDKVAQLDVTYNAVSGYPEKIFIDVDERMADEEITHIVKEL